MHIKWNIIVPRRVSALIRYKRSSYLPKFGKFVPGCVVMMVVWICEFGFGYGCTGTTDVFWKYFKLFLKSQFQNKNCLIYVKLLQIRVVGILHYNLVHILCSNYLSSWFFEIFTRRTQYLMYNLKQRNTVNATIGNQLKH